MENKLTIAIILFVAIFLGFVAYEISVINSSHSETKFEAALAAENPEDKCATPEGYTDEEWREHMGHHPDMYGECLNKSK